MLIFDSRTTASPTQPEVKREANLAVAAEIGATQTRETTADTSNAIAARKASSETANAPTSNTFNPSPKSPKDADQVRISYSLGNVQNSQLEI